MSIPGVPASSQRPPGPRVGERKSIDWFLVLAGLAALAGTLIAGYLAYATLGGTSVAGCGGDSGPGCDQVLSSRWSSWFHLPVGVPATFVYFMALVGVCLVGQQARPGMNRAGWALLSATTLLAAGAAIWFIGLQLLSLGSVCWYCLSLHGCGLLLTAFTAWRLPQELVARAEVRRGVLAGTALGVLGLVTLFAGQLLITPAEPGMEVVTVAPVASEPTDDEPAKTSDATAPAASERTSSRVPDHPWDHRRLALLGGAASLDIYDYPLYGDREALSPLVEIFDYTCPHCRELFQMLHAVEGDYGGELALVLLPVPMNPKCNPNVKTEHEKHKDACELTRLAIAVWQSKPSVFLDYHSWLLSGKEPPTVAEAEAEAARLVGADTLEAALADPAVDIQLKENCRIYAVARDTSRKGEIPKLIYGNNVSNGKPDSEEHLRLFLETQVGLVPTR